MFLIKIYFLKKNPKSCFHYFTINLTCAKIKYSININNKIKYNIKINNKIKQLLPWPQGPYCINLVTHLDNHPNLPNIIFATQSRVSECLQSNPMLLHKSPRCHDPFSLLCDRYHKHSKAAQAPKKLRRVLKATFITRCIA